MTAFIMVVSVSLTCLIFLAIVGAVADWAVKRAHSRLRPKDRPQDPYENRSPAFWHGDPPDGDTFP